MHQYAEDFYGKPMRVVALGFLRQGRPRRPAQQCRAARSLPGPLPRQQRTRRHTLSPQKLRVTSLPGHVASSRRPEVKFSGVQELLDRIRKDIGVARSQLDSSLWSGYQADPFLLDEST